MQKGFKTALHSVHTTGAYGSTGISGIGFTGVHTAPKGSTTRVASIRELGHAFQDRRTPSRFSSSAKSIAPATRARRTSRLGAGATRTRRTRARR